MPDFTVHFPLDLSNIGIGFEPINEENLNDMVNFNLKMIIFTEPGERIMFPDFGVGIRRYLFQQSTQDFSELSFKIRSQIRRYASYVNLLDLSLEGDDHVLSVELKYEVPKTDISDTLQLDIPF